MEFELDIVDKRILLGIIRRVREGNIMENRIPSNENRRSGGEPQRIGDILVELMARYEGRFPAPKIAVVQAPVVMEDQSCSFYPAELASVS